MPSPATTMALTEEQDRIISISMRVCGAISLVGCVFVVLTFALSRRFRRPVNRLIFYASWGNMALAICGILSIDPIREPYGPGTAICTAQGFMVQMFLPSDALWNLSMAINVYLTIFKRWEVERMKRLELMYAILNFGGPLVVAFAYLFVNDPVKGRIYGPASIWCWVTPEWDSLRIALLYAPSWICIVIIFGIYVAAGNFIYQKRRGLNSARVTPPSYKRHSWVPLRDNSTTGSNDPFTATKTTQIKITTEPSSAHDHHEAHPCSTTNTSQDSDSVDGTTQQSPTAIHATIPSAPAYEPYSVTINGGTKNAMMSPNPEMDDTYDEDGDLGLFSPTSVRRPSFSRQKSSLDPTEATRVTSRNRGADAARRHTMAAQRQQTHVAWSYTKVALLYFLSLLSTWVPSSVNRVYSLVHQNDVNFGLSMAAAFVLPLVGFWNALIYAVTSWDAIREVFWEAVDGISGQSRGRRP